MDIKVYDSTSGKVADFLIGFFVLGGSLDLLLRFGLTGIIGSDPSLALPALGIAGVLSALLAVYLYGRRKFMGIGFGAVLIGHLLAVSTYILMIFAK